MALQCVLYRMLTEYRMDRHFGCVHLFYRDCPLGKEVTFRHRQDTYIQIVKYNLITLNESMPM